MELELRQLVGRYGFKAVKECLDQEMKTTYQYLHQYFSATRPVENTVCVPLSTTSIQTKNVLFPEEQEKEKEKEKEGAQAKGKERTVSLSTMNTKVSTKKEQVISLTKVAEPDPPPKPDPLPSTELLSLKEAVQKKRDELLAQGVNPESLLTKENLDTWVKEGKSYAEIARLTGNNQTVVSGSAKGFGLTSKVKPYFYKKK